MPPTTETQILVVGAGPTGLFTAAELRRHGVSCRIVDRGDGSTDQARASGIQARTLEILDALGIVERFLREGVPCAETIVYAPPRTRLKHIDDSELETPFPFTLDLEQSRTERLLEGHLAGLGTEVERRVALADLQQEEEGVVAVLQHACGRDETLRAAYLIGCDGAHSFVRQRLRVSFEGEDYATDFLIADIRIDWALPNDRIAFFLAPDGMFIYAPLADGRGLLLADLGSGEEELPRGQPSLDEIQAIVDRRGPGGTVRNPRWKAYFRAHCRQAERYRIGRVFLAGDAAQVQSPLGGQGMNSGIQDGYNLAWKLALVLGRRAPDTLLESYHLERHRAGQDSLALSDYLHHTVLREEPHRSLSDSLLRKLAVLLAGQPAVQRSLRRTHAELNVSYRHSPIVGQHRRLIPLPGDGDPGLLGWHDFGAAPHAGDRALDARVLRHPGGEPVRFFHAFRSTSHHLVLFAGAEASEQTYRGLASIADAVRRTHAEDIDASLVSIHAPPAGLPDFMQVLIDPSTDLHHRYGARARCLYLIRLDGYVGFRSQPADLEALSSYLTGLFVA